MSALLKQLFCIIVLLSVALFLIDIFSMRIGPDHEILDTEQATLFGELNSHKDTQYVPSALSIWQNRWEAALLGYPILAHTEKPKLIFLGGSSTEQGFRPPDMSPLFPEFEAHCVGITLGMLPDVKGLVQMTISTLRPEVLERSVFVIGVYHSIFRGERTDSIIPQYQHQMYPSFFPDPGSKKPPALDTKTFTLLLRLVRPFYWLQFQFTHFNAKRHHAMRLAADAGSPVDKFIRFFSVLTLKQPDPVFKPKRYDWSKDLSHIVRFWDEAHFLRSSDKRFNQVQFEILTEIVSTIVATKAKVVLVDLPVSSIHRDVIKSGRAYQAVRHGIFKRLADEYGAVYIDMQQEFPDDSFVDSLHPGPGWSRFWAQSFSQHFRELQEVPKNLVVPLQ